MWRAQLQKSRVPARQRLGGNAPLVLPDLLIHMAFGGRQDYLIAKGCAVDLAVFRFNQNLVAFFNKRDWPAKCRLWPHMGDQTSRSSRQKNRASVIRAMTDSRSRPQGGDARVGSSISGIPRARHLGPHSATMNHVFVFKRLRRLSEHIPEAQCWPSNTRGPLPRNRLFFQPAPSTPGKLQEWRKHSGDRFPLQAYANRRFFLVGALTG